MKPWQIWVAVGVVALGAAWMLRYDVTWIDGDETAVAAFITDRWLGTAFVCNGQSCFQFYPPPKK